MFDPMQFPINYNGQDILIYIKSWGTYKHIELIESLKAVKTFHTISPRLNNLLCYQCHGMQYLSLTDSNLSYVLSDVYVNFALVVVGPLSTFTIRSVNNMLCYDLIILQIVCNNPLIIHI